MKLYPWNCGLALMALCLVWPAEAAVLIPLNATWKYHKGTSEASSPDTTAWRQLGFNDSGWSSGAMPFYYGENLSGGTVLSDMRYNYSTVYLRREFVVSDPEAVGSLDLNSMSDDGFIAWINGNLVRLYNVNTPSKAYNGFADVGAQEPVQLTNYRLPDPSNYLVEGVNVIAIQALNVNLDSSDLVVNMQLVSAEPDFDPPVILSVDPPPGTVGGLSEITVRFSEPVFGVNREDLLLNGTTANAVIAADDTFRFQFDPQAPGSFEVTWADGHGIVDLAEPPNAFDATAEGATWEYLLEDQVAPWMTSAHPVAGRTLRQFSAVEILFTEPVTGVDAGDLLANGEPAVSVSGLAAGPYRFEFEPVTSGPVSLQWAGGHQIEDLASNALVTSTWSYTVNAGFEIGDLVINEIVCANQNGLVDEDGETQDWIEIWNRGTSTVNLLGWSLTDDAGQPGQWVFPGRSLAPGQYLVVFASGKDRKPALASARLHTNFKLSSAGEYLGLFSPELPQAIVSELAPEFPEQRNDYSYGRISDGTWRYFSSPTPGGPNGSSAIEGVTDPVHFSAVRGFYNVPFNLLMSCETPGAVIRYTLNGSEPTAQGGTEYTGPILINRTEFVRAAAFAQNRLPSMVASHSYFYNLPAALKSLPVVSLQTRSNNLWGSTGIMETSPRNTTQRGLAWERPVSVEWIEAADNGGFQIDAGLRIQGGNYVRQRYDPNGSLPFSKYSFRLYFRGDYGTSELEYPVMPGSAVDVFDKLVLRAGMNDHSNPFVVDELVRRLASDMGHVASLGTFVTLFLNGEHQGYYNPTERIDADFLRSWHGGTNEWDLIAQFGEVREGDTVEWNAMRNAIAGRDMSQASNYAEADRRLDLVNFVDYLLVNIYAGTGDWPHNNWRAARERVPGAKFRFYVWDAEWAFGNQGRSVNVNTLTEELARDADIAHFYQALRLSPEFRLLFADRIQKHLFNEGALTDDHITSRFLDLRFRMAGVLPRMNTTILGTWIPQRRAIIMQHLQSAGLLAAVAAPVLDPHGGRVPSGQAVNLSAPQGDIYYTTNGADPRVRFSGSVAPDAIHYTGGEPLILEGGMVLKARALNGGAWSALSEATFQVGGPGSPLRITEIMYNPAGGSAYEFLELRNVGATTLDLSRFRFEGIEFEFPENTALAPGGFLVLASDENPAAFASRYPGVAVAGYFGGNLSNGGERISVMNAQGVTMTSVSYDDENGWPLEADGQGPSLEIVDRFGDPNDPLNWHARTGEWGSPGYSVLPAPLPEGPRLSEFMADNGGSVPHEGTFPDWIELYNPTESDIDLAGWSLSDDGNDPIRFVFPAGTILPADGYRVVWCDSEFGAPGLHAGFALGRLGETVWLHDPEGGRVDAMTFGMQIPDYSIGVLEPGSGEWILTEPTPGAANVAAVTGSPDQVALNEWLANPMSGGAQWIELFNRDADLPVALKGLAFAVNGGVYQMNSLSFLAPGGFALLYPDGNPGANHLDLELAPTEGTLSLLSETGFELDQVNHTTQAAGVSQGRLPDGGEEIVAFVGTASPEASNYVPLQNGPILNELMARNQGAVPNNSGRMADWVELANPTESAFELTGMSLSLNPGNPTQWVFPAGSSLAAGDHLVVWFDGSSAPTTTASPEPNTGRSLPGQSGAIHLYDAAGRLMDRVEYGPQLVDRSVGRSSGEWRLMSTPTPGDANAASAELGSPTGVRINEWMAGPDSGADWIELFNQGEFPVSLGGLFLSDDPSTVGQTKHEIAPLSFIGPGGFALFEADGSVTSGANHVGFSLNRAGETLRFNISTQSTLDSVDFGPQEAGVSEGRLLDGGANVVSFATTPTPGLPNYLPLTNVVINEVLAHTDPPLEDAIELRNTGSSAVNVGGWYLSDLADNFRMYRIPDDTLLDAGGFSVFYEEQLNGGEGSLVPFSLDSEQGETVWLSETDAAGVLTGYRVPVAFGASPNGVAFGRFQTSAGVDFVALEQSTFGVSNPATLEQFRSGQGALNAYPRVGPVVFGEIHYHPDPEPGVEEGFSGEYLELQNITDSSVTLYDPAAPTNTWRVAVGVEYQFPEGVTLEAGERMLLVDFDPVASPATLAAFQAMYQVPGGARIMGPFTGRLDNAGERIELLMPDAPTTTGPNAGFVPYVLVEAVEYARAGLWPVEADGTGQSLQRREAAAYGNEPLNWLAAMPTAGLPNADAPPPLDSDGDGMPDDWEIANGFDPEYAGDANEDFDGDGIPNVDEFRSGTDPRDPVSRLHLTVTVDESGDAWIEFPAAAQRSYSILRRDSLEAGGWEKLMDVGAEASPRIVTVHDDNGDPRASRFYRIRTPALL